MSTWQARNKDRVAAINKKYRATHLELCKERARKSAVKWYHANKDKSKAHSAEWALRNPERRAAIVRKSRKKNRGPRNFWRAKERARLRNATPIWADVKRIKAIYRESSRLTKETGVRHHVDHVIPLASALVCGLHVDSNLQILTANVNQHKSNNFFL